jgi:hypothetical protein
MRFHQPPAPFTPSRTTHVKGTHSALPIEHHHRFGVVRELEVVMAPPIRTLLWILNLLVIVLLVGTLFGMFGMGGGMMMGGGWMFGMHSAGFVWLVALTVVIAVLVVLLARGQVD